MAGDRAGGPTVRRILVGAELRRLREASGISRDDAADAIRASESKISRLELGRVGFKERDIADLLTCYGVTDEEQRSAVLALAREANAPGWWYNYDSVLPHWFHTYVGLEQACTQIRTYELQFVPGLLQTEDYARAVTISGNPTMSPEDVELRVAFRMARQQILVRPDPPLLWAVVDEAVLHRPIGGTAVLRAQVARLLDLVDLPNLALQVVPFRVGGHAAEGGAFSILRFPEPDLPDLVYLEQLTGALYLDKRDHVERYVRTMDRLTTDSLTPDRSATALRELVSKL